MMDKLKEFLGKLSSKTKKLLIAGGIGLVAIAVIIAMALGNKPYAVMFNGVSSEEAQQILGKLQEDGISYQYRNGEILVPEADVDVVKAKLVSEGYPKSGFTYDVFKNNVGLMTTDTDRQTFKIYDLETRIGSTIRIFEGVKDAYVTIALGETSKYALSDDETQEASAQAVVVMADGGSPTQEQAASIQRLISRSIPGLVIDNVSVFDGNGREVSAEVDDLESNSGKAGEEIAQLIENQITDKITKVLSAVYGSGNVRVAVKGQVNMEKLIRESITYNTPEKIDEQDKQGLVSEDSRFSEYSGDGRTASGIAGAESNADIPQYNTGGEAGNNAYGSNSLTRKYLLNQIKEQGQINPGVLEDLTVSIVINGENFGDLTADEIRDLAGNAAGIVPAERPEKITVVSAPFYQIAVPDPPDPPDKKFNTTLIIAVAAGAVLLLLILILVLVIIGKKKKKKKAMMAQQEGYMMVPISSQAGAQPDEEGAPGDDLADIGNEKGAELRNNIRDFSDQNPEIAAQLLKTWLNGGDSENG